MNPQAKHWWNGRLWFSTTSEKIVASVGGVLLAALWPAHQVWIGVGIVLFVYSCAIWLISRTVTVRNLEKPQT